jgi:hypothetical protein
MPPSTWKRHLISQSGLLVVTKGESSNMEVCPVNFIFRRGRRNPIASPLTLSLKIPLKS